MTCIVAYKGITHIVMGGDSAGVSGLDITMRKDPKVFKNGPFLIGYTTSFRMGQILMDIEFPKQKKSEDEFKYMRTSFVNSVRSSFKEFGFGDKGEDGEQGGEFLVVYKKEIYKISDDYQVGMSIFPFEAAGSGELYAKGALYTYFAQYNETTLDPTHICEHALETAAVFNAGVRSPFKFLKVKI